MFTDKLTKESAREQHKPISCPICGFDVADSVERVIKAALDVNPFPTFNLDLLAALKIIYAYAESAPDAIVALDLIADTAKHAIEKAEGR